METCSAAEALPVDAVIEAAAVSSSIAEPADALIDISTADGSERPMSVFRPLRDDVDDAGNRIRTPDSATRSSNDFDTLDILKYDAVLERPIDTRKKRSIEAAAVYHYQHRL